MEFNVDPYYDDFEQNAADNNYLRILFKPGTAVQARELTQIQSILQNQIKQFGNHIFQNGSPVIGGNLTLDNKVKYLKLETSYNNNDVNVEDYVGKIIRNTKGNIQAKVLTTYYPTNGTPTLLVKYITGNEFVDGEIITIATTTTQAQLISSGSSGLATVCSINEGVFYVDGFFVKVLDQTTPVNPEGTSANVKIGLQISEDIVDSISDTTLLDPAQGSFNYQAPGADRYQFNLTLSTRPIDSVVDESKFFELMRVENGIITKQVKYPVYAELEKSLARRTYDESGDYTVRPFRASVSQGANSENYTISIEPGKAYVKGFEFETLGTVKIDVPKPRSEIDTKTYTEVDIDTSYGNYVYVTSIHGSSNGFVDISSLETVDIHTVDTANVAVGLGTTANVQVYANTKIGTARVKNFSREAADLFNATSDSNGIFKVYLSDVNIQPKAAKIVAANTANITLGSKFSAVDNAYANVILTILPIRLDAVANVDKANVFQYSYTLNANSAGAFTGTVNVGDTIRVGDMVRQVVNVDSSGNFLTVNTAWTQTIVGTHSSTNPLSVYIQTDYTQNVSSQSRTVKSYNGTIKTLELDSPFDNNGIPDSNTVIQLNYGLDDAGSFIAGVAVTANNLVVPSANASMNVSSISKLADGSTVATDPLNNKLLFQLPGNYTQRGSLGSVSYYYNKFVSNRGISSPGVFSLSQGDPLETGVESIGFSDSNSAIRDNLIAIVRDNGGSLVHANGSILQLTSSNVDIGSLGESITIDTGDTALNNIDIIVNVKVANAHTIIRTKEFKSNTTPTLSGFNYPTTDSTADVTVTLPGLANTVAKINVASGFIWLPNTEFNSIKAGESISLFTPDVIRVRKILAGNTTHYPDANNYTDVTNSFALNSGQKDDIYDHASIQLLSGYDTINAKILVHVDLFKHIYNSQNVSFFSVDSYPETIYNTGQIPIYRNSTGDIYYLRDCLDFRPTRQIGDTANALQVPDIPGTDTTTELSFSYYLPRIDKLVLSKDKEFRIIQGKSAPRPIPPNDIDDAMTLFQINLPPYVANINDVSLKYFDNRRFTMKDIAKISKKIDQLSYFVSLNNVENQALSDPTQYEDGTDKAKYGIVGENFTNFNIADYKNKDFGVTLDNGMMIPAIRYYVAGLKEISSSSTSQNMKTVSLEYTEAQAIVQGVCSDKAVSIQPFLFGAFNGTVELYPDTDYWVSETLKPEVISPPPTIVSPPIVIREVLPPEPPAPPYQPPLPPTPPITYVTGGYPPAPEPAPAPPPEPVVVVVPQPVDPPPPPRSPPNLYPCEASSNEFFNVTTIWQSWENYDLGWGTYTCVWNPVPPVWPPAPPPPPPDPPPPPPQPAPPPIPAPSGGGGGSVGTGCPDPSMLILLADDTWVAAGDLQVGMVVKTQHENTFAWGDFNVTAKSIMVQPKLEVVFDSKKVIVSESHRFWVDNRTAWINTKDVEVGDVINGLIVREINDVGEGPVVRITVDEAHTYIMEGLLSHNMKYFGDELDVIW